MGGIHSTPYVRNLRMLTKARVLHYSWLERLARNKHSSLLPTGKLRRKQSVVNTAPSTVFTTQIVLRNL
jgi:hypothetical protein